MAPQLSKPSLSRRRKQRSSEASIVGREDYSCDMTTESPSPVKRRKKRRSGGGSTKKQKKRHSGRSSTEKQKKRESSDDDSPSSDDDLIPVMVKRRRHRKDIPGGASLKESDFIIRPISPKNLRKLPSRNHSLFDDWNEKIKDTPLLERVSSMKKRKTPPLSSFNNVPSEVPESNQDMTSAESNGSVIIHIKKLTEKELPAHAPCLVEREPPTDAPPPVKSFKDVLTPAEVPATELEELQEEETSPSNLTIAMSELQVVEPTVDTQALGTEEKTSDNPIVGIEEHTLTLETTTLPVDQIEDCNETVVAEVINTQEAFTIEGMFNWLLPKAAKTKASSQLLLADILRRDNIFLILAERHREILNNSYLMTSHTTEELFRMLINSLQALVQGELREITTSYHQVLDLLN